MNAPVPSTYDPNVDNLANAEEQCRRLAHEKELLQMDLQRARARYRNDMNSLRTESKAQMEAVRSKQAQLEAELPVLRDVQLPIKIDFEILSSPTFCFKN